jgi:hypothetical protein
MCYLIYISTDSAEDLSLHNSALIRFEKDFGKYSPEVMDLLLYQYPWYVASKAGCSCAFRHLTSIELGFGKPVDWYDEDLEEIQATQNFYDVASSLIFSGNQLDCIEIWTGTRKDQIKHLNVDLSSIGRDEFRFFENHHFLFSITQ